MPGISDLRPDIERIFDDETSKSQAPGVIMGIVDKDGLVFWKAKGQASIEQNIPIDQNTIMKWGSISKLFTCIGIFQQWEQGKFQVSDPVNKFLPKGKLVPKHEDWPEVTIEHLLTHTAGIGELRRGSDLLVKGFRLVTYDDQPVPPLRSLHDLPLLLSAPAGQKYAYSNIGGSLLGYLTEIFSGEDFQAYMIAHVLDPLGMVTADFAKSSRVAEHAAAGYRSKKGRLRIARPWNNIIKPSGGLEASLEDMAKFVACLLRKGEHDGGRLLDPSTFDLLWTTHYSPHEALQDIDSLGYIFRIAKLGDKKIIYHTGSVSGFTATLDIIPEDGIGILTAANLSEELTTRVTTKLKNRVLKCVAGSTNTFEPDRHTPDRSIWPRIKGYYGAYPGWLSNTRVLLEGIDFKVTAKKDHLMLSSLFGHHKRGTVLYPTENPVLYEYPVPDDGDIDYTVKIGFTQDPATGKIAGMNIEDFNRLQKKSIINTFGFKLSVSICAIIASLGLALIILLFRV
jgi:CubicO group peptidase (beta-lactamase class C family)